MLDLTLSTPPPGIRMICRMISRGPAAAGEKN